MDFFLTHPNFIIFEYNLMFPDYHEMAKENASKLRLDILIDIEKLFRAVKRSKNITVTYAIFKEVV